jgi:hypothetical protein
LYDFNKFLDLNAEKKIKIKTDKFKNPAYDQRVINERVNRSLNALIKDIESYVSRNKRMSKHDSMPQMKIHRIMDLDQRDSFQYLKMHNNKGLVFPSLTCNFPMKASKKKGSSRLAEYSESIQLFKAGKKIKSKYQMMEMNNFKPQINEEKCKFTKSGKTVSMSRSIECLKPMFRS